MTPSATVLCYRILVGILIFLVVSICVSIAFTRRKSVRVLGIGITLAACVMLGLIVCDLLPEAMLSMEKSSRPALRRQVLDFLQEARRGGEIEDEHNETQLRCRTQTRSTPRIATPDEERVNSPPCQSNISAKNVENKDCPICFGKVETEAELVMLCNGNQPYHRSCLQKMVQSSRNTAKCPTCREPLDLEMLGLEPGSF